MKPQEEAVVEPQEEAGVESQELAGVTAPPVPAAAPGLVWRWKEALLARVRPSDYHISDDEIFVILIDGEDGKATADLRAEKGVTVPMYCVWKKKYKRLHFDDLRKARRKDLRRRYALAGVCLAAAVVAIGGAVFALARALNPPVTVAAQTALPSTPRTKPAPAQSRPTVNSQPKAASPQPETRQAASETRPAGPETRPVKPEAAKIESGTASAAPPAAAEPEPPGYKIQVAAAPSLHDGRAAVERLASAGYPAYLTRATVGTREVFRVRVGPYDTPAAAEEIVVQLKSAGYGGAWIAR